MDLFKEMGKAATLLKKQDDIAVKAFTAEDPDERERLFAQLEANNKKGADLMGKIAEEMGFGDDTKWQTHEEKEAAGKVRSGK